MFRIVKKERLNPTVTKMVIDAPFIAKKAEPGQFIILRALEDSERIEAAHLAEAIQYRSSSTLK